MRHTPFLFSLPVVLLLLCICTLVSCKEDEEESYPALVTELAMARADQQGRMISFTTDDGVIHHVANDIKGMTANSRLRALVSYVKTAPPDGAPAENSFATVYSARAVPVLWDWTDDRDTPHDPTGIQSAWLAGGFVNLHLTPKTHGGKQAWGFSQDSVTVNALGSTTHHLSLCHQQGEDATAYTTDLFACISLDSIALLAPHDSIRLTVFTFNSPATWQFARE